MVAHNFAIGTPANRVTRFLDNEELARYAPSIFADRAHDSRSARYSHIPTSAVVEGLRGEGFFPVVAQESRSRSMEKHGFAKHLVRFRRADASAVVRVGDVFPEVVLVNSHDGSCSYRILAGLFRLVCSNGLCCPDSSGEEVRIAHKGSVVENVIDASYKVLERSTIAIESAERWRSIELTSAEQTALAIGAHHVRFAKPDGTVDTPIRPDQLLIPRRVDDRKNDLWTTFNRVQENAVKGGLRGYGPGADGRRRRTTTKGVNGIDGSVAINQAIWKLAEYIANNK